MSKSKGKSPIEYEGDSSDSEHSSASKPSSDEVITILQEQLAQKDYQLTGMMQKMEIMMSQLNSFSNGSLPVAQQDMDYGQRHNLNKKLIS